MHQLPKEAVLSITIVDNIANLEVRLPFGVATGPSKYSTMSEMVFDNLVKRRAEVKVSTLTPQRKERAGPSQR